MMPMVEGTHSPATSKEDHEKAIHIGFNRNSRRTVRRRLQQQREALPHGSGDPGGYGRDNDRSRHDKGPRGHHKTGGTDNGSLEASNDNEALVDDQTVIDDQAIINNQTTRQHDPADDVAAIVRPAIAAKEDERIPWHAATGRVPRQALTQLPSKRRRPGPPGS